MADKPAGRPGRSARRADDHLGRLPQDLRPGHAHPRRQRHRQERERRSSSSPAATSSSPTTSSRSG
ncbi:MAG: hypothetical protein MZW92_61220 [Comamonadaceae bacterium]|nr:hypothetical protein [Comamonadaceae bacterium]